MIQIELTLDEAEMLRAILEVYLADLRVEIADTDEKGYRQVLKEEARFIQTCLQRLRENASQIPA